MAKKSGVRINIKMVSTADTGYFKTTQKNKRNTPEKMELKMYDPVVRKHVVFKESNKFK